MRQRLADFGRGVAALALLLLLVVGIPIFLVVGVGWPLPAEVPSADAVQEALTRRGIDDMVVVKTIAVLLWLTWAQIAVAFLIEVAALVRGRAPSRVPALPAVQVMVAKLVAAVALVASVGGTPKGDVPSSPRPIAAVALVSHPAAAPIPPAAPPPVPTAATAQPSTTYVVQRHDSLWSIAEQALGDGFRWREIRDLNVGRTMPDGHSITSTTETIEPGWALELPRDATTSAAPAPPTPSDVVVVERGDHLWSIAEESLADDLGREPTDAEVVPRWQQIIEANRADLADPANPSLVYAGQSIAIPGDAYPEERADEPVAPPPSDATTSTPTPVPTTATTAMRADPAPSSVDAGSIDVRDGEESSVPTGMFGVAGATIAVGVGAALLRRRRRRLLHVPRGAMPPPPPPELDDVRRDLLLAADEDHVALVSGALRELGSALSIRESAARPRLLQTDGRRVEVLLSSTVLPTPDGWRAEGGGTVWVRDASNRSWPAADVGPGPAVLVATGAQQQTGQLYLDLEAEALVSITGDTQAVRRVVNSMALELANTPISEGVHAIAVGLTGLESLEECETMRVVDDWDEIADDLVTRAEQSHALFAANRWPNAFTARAKAGWRDDLTPVVVFLREAPDDARFERLCQLVATGATTLSIVIAGDVPNATRVVLDGDLMHLPGLGVTCRSQAVDAETIDRVVEVLTDADHLPAQLPLIEEVPGGVSLGDRAVDEEPEILVRLLGEIDVVGGRKPLTPKQTAVVAYIALHAPVAAERIEDAIWTEPTSSRRKRMSNTVSDCRFALGEDHLPFAHEGRYRVGPRVGTDLDLFERRVAFAADRPSVEAVALLRQALELVRGPVFTYRSLDRSSYVWVDIENWMTTWELKIAAAALKLSELALELGDNSTAVWAAERGLLALPTNSPLTEALMKAYRAAGDVDAAERVYERHVAALQELGLDDVAETTIDLRERIQSSSAS
ncbi:MAG: BTAD domain-containing putative transcriptional regulator [Acidimicrobiia bacterium]